MCSCCYHTEKWNLYYSGGDILLLSDPFGPSLCNLPPVSSFFYLSHHPSPNLLPTSFLIFSFPLSSSYLPIHHNSFPASSPSFSNPPSWCSFPETLTLTSLEIEDGEQELVPAFSYLFDFVLCNSATPFLSSQPFKRLIFVDELSTFVEMSNRVFSRSFRGRRKNVFRREALRQ